MLVPQKLIPKNQRAITMDNKPIFGRNGNFKPSVPVGAVRPKPVPVPEKTASK